MTTELSPHETKIAEALPYPEPQEDALFLSFLQEVHFQCAKRHFEGVTDCLAATILDPASTEQEVARASEIYYEAKCSFEQIQKDYEARYPEGFEERFKQAWLDSEQESSK